MIKEIVFKLSDMFVTVSYNNSVFLQADFCSLRYLQSHEFLIYFLFTLN